MLIIGLTGSIGMGKSATARMFVQQGVPVHDADAAVHALYKKGGAAVDAIARAFPEAVRDGAVDRARLGEIVVANPDAMRRLEAIIHPFVRAEQEAWLRARAAEGAKLVVLDIPLLLETGAQESVDIVVLVSAPEDAQRTRVLKRPGMTPERLEALLKRQMPDSEKRRHAHFVVETDKGLAHAEAQVKGILRALAGREGRVWRSGA
jgi:dephospho-CoA kinase